MLKNNSSNFEFKMATEDIGTCIDLQMILPSCNG